MSEVVARGGGRSLGEAELGADCAGSKVGGSMRETLVQVAAIEVPPQRLPG